MRAFARAVLATLAIAAMAQGQITSPDKFFGFQLGSDKKMARAHQAVNGCG